MSDEIIILSPEDSFLDAFCTGHRTNLVMLQRAIEKNEGKPGKRELERRLGRMRTALLAKNIDAAEGWLYALVDGIKAVDVWIEKSSGKIKQEKALTPEVRGKGTAANAKASANRRMALNGAVADYCARLKQTTWSPAGCLKWMKSHTHDAEGKLIKEPDRYYSNGKFCGYERSTAERYIRKMLEKRKSQ